MNATDRREATKLMRIMQTALGILDDLRSSLTEMTEKEEDKFDDMDERGLGETAIAEAIQDAHYTLSDANQEVDEAHTSLEAAILALEEVTE